jgi:hypothetical protein
MHWLSPEDMNTKQTERFDLQLNNAEKFAYEASNLFTGIEWWNKIGNFPYPIRYHVQVSQLMFGLTDNPSDSESIVYAPYNILIPNSEGSNMQYRFISIILESNLVAFAMTLSMGVAKMV